MYSKKAKRFEAVAARLCRLVVTPHGVCADAGVYKVFQKKDFFLPQRIFLPLHILQKSATIGNNASRVVMLTVAVHTQHQLRHPGGAFFTKLSPGKFYGIMVMGRLQKNEDNMRDIKIKGRHQL